jgi:hypothetical protein
MMKCVDDRGSKFTFVGEARHLKKLLANGKASDPEGMKPEQLSFPVVLTGWPKAS